MKIKLAKTELGGNPPAQWLRRAGYTLIHDYRSGQDSFSRRFNREHYPRFHLYVEELDNSEYLFFNLHLDHKQASYAGSKRHSADYDGDLVEGEAKRLKALMVATQSTPVSSKANGLNQGLESDVLQRINRPDLNQRRAVKKSFWQKLFS